MSGSSIPPVSADSSPDTRPEVSSGAFLPLFSKEGDSPAKAIMSGRSKRARHSGTPAEKPVLTILLPCHNEEENLSVLFAKLEEILEDLSLSYEILCVDDGSRDATYGILMAHRVRNSRIKVMRLARNFGKEVAVSCGLHHAKGQAVILMDSDLQHPPEVLPRLVEKWRQGAQMVYAIRRNRDTDSPLRSFLSRGYYFIFRTICEIELPAGAGDFRLLDRKVVDAVNAMPERNRFMKGMMTWVGFRQEEVPFVPAPRFGGHSAWSFSRLFKFGFDGVASFSTVPLRVWSYFGFATSLLALGYLAFLVIRTLIFGIDVPGFASLMVAILFLGGIQLICLGVMGEYIGRVFTEVKHRPLYLVAESEGVDSGVLPPKMESRS